MTARSRCGLPRASGSASRRHPRCLRPTCWSRFRGYLDALGIARSDQVIRTLAHRGVADHDDQFVTPDLFPLTDAIGEVRRRFAEHRARATASAQWFPAPNR
jgi:hypothetical protein